jgi:hypothetical protein
LEGTLQWDGHYITLEALGGKKPKIYRLAVDGSKTRIAGTVRLSMKGQFWDYLPTAIQGAVVVAAIGSAISGRPDEVAFWTYPKGGKPDRVIRRRTFKEAYAAFIDELPCK